MRRIDLNLLYVLRELLEEPNTTKVGTKLGLTQPAISASLGRLRHAFQDDLFIRSGRAMVPTRRAESLLQPVEEIIRNIEALVEEVYFEPEALRRTFTITTNEFLLQLIAAPVMSAIRPLAPGSRILFSPFTVDTRDRLRSGHLDLVLGPMFESFIEDAIVSSQPLYRDRLVAAVWSGSDAYGDAVTEKQLIDAHYAAYNPTTVNGWRSSVQYFLDKQGLQLKSVVEFSSLNPLIYALRGSDVLAIVPEKLVDALGADADVRAVELPFAAAEFEVGLIWNRAMDSDPEHAWFRTQAYEALRDL